MQRLWKALLVMVVLSTVSGAAQALSLQIKGTAGYLSRVGAQRRRHRKNFIRQQCVFRAVDLETRRAV
jgi:hypothetical protein